MNYLSAIGLLLDIIGVVLLFMYGLEGEFARFNLNQFKNDPKFPVDILEREIAKNKPVILKSKLALIIIIVGFIFQFLGCLNFC